YSGDGGLATSASVQPYDVSIGPDGSLYITSTPCPGTIRKVSNGIINRWAGNLDCSSSDVYPGSTTRALNLRLEGTPGPAFYGSGSVFIADSGGTAVYVVPPNQIVAWLVNAGPNGDGTHAKFVGYSGDGGLALKALINGPTGLATDSL